MTNTNRISCVYFLYREGILIYIGQTLHLARRIKEHRYEYDLVKWIECTPDQLRPLEKRMIRMFKPLANLKMNPDQAGHQKKRIYSFDMAMFLDLYFSCKEKKMQYYI